MDNIILFPEWWKIRLTELEQQDIHSLKEVLRNKNIPSNFSLNEGDQVLKLSFSKEIDLEILLSVIKK